MIFRRSPVPFIWKIVIFVNSKTEKHTYSQIDMKKLLISLCPIFALSLIGILSLTSCTKEDDQFDFDYMDMEFEYEVSQDIFDVADIQITYIDFEGKEITEPLKSLKWETRFQTKEIPATCVFRTSATLKDGITLKKSEYTIQRELDYELEEYYKGGLPGWSKSGVKKRNIPCSKEDLEYQISLLNQNIKFTVTQGTDGSYIVTEQ